jgi:hypothetical protein
MTMVSKLGDLLSYGYLGILELPMHSNSCQSRMISVRCCYFRFLVSPKTHLWVLFKHVPGVLEKI